MRPSQCPLPTPASTPASTRPRPGAPPPPPARRAKPEKPRRRRPSLFGGFFRLLFMLAAVGSLGGAVAGLGLYRHIAADLPDYRWLADYQPPQMSRIYAADSRLLAELATERRVFVPIEAIPKRVQAAFVSAEDQRFWEHHGVDPLGILRAVVTDIEQYGTGRRPGRRLDHHPAGRQEHAGRRRPHADAARCARRSWRIRIEEALPKDRILELYLNEIFLGYQAYGVAAAAQAYFNKGLDELTLGEIGLPRRRCPRRRTTTTRCATPRPPRRGATGCWTAWPRTAPSPPQEADGRQGRADRAPPAAAARGRAGRPVLHRGGAARTDQPLRPEQTTMGGLVVRTSLDPAAAGGDRAGAARRADRL